MLVKERLTHFCMVSVAKRRRSRDMPDGFRRFIRRSSFVKACSRGPSLIALNCSVCQPCRILVSKSPDRISRSSRLPFAAVATRVTHAMTVVSTFAEPPSLHHFFWHSPANTAESVDTNVDRHVDRDRWKTSR
jgi:hypothetical protein